jgi:hypothetical protein
MLKNRIRYPDIQKPFDPKKSDQDGMKHVHVKNFEVYCGLFVVIQIQKHKTGSNMSISIVSLRINKDAKNLSFSSLQHENVKTSIFVSSFRHNQ